MKKRKIRGFIVNLNDSLGHYTEFQFTESGYAEQVLRGLVHAGYSCSIREELMDIPNQYVRLLSDEKEHGRGNWVEDDNEAPITATLRVNSAVETQ